MGTNLKQRADEIMALTEAPGLPAAQGSDENGALRKAVSAANHWFEAYKIAQRDLIAIEDARDILDAGGRARRNYALTAAAAGGLFLLNVLQLVLR